MSELKTTKELIQATREAFEASKLPPHEHFAHLVNLGWIDRKGRVTKLLGGTAEPEKSAKAHSRKKKTGA